MGHPQIRRERMPQITFNELRAEIGPEKTLADLTAEDVEKITEHYRSGVEWNNLTALRYECVLKYELELKEAGE